MPVTLDAADAALKSIAPLEYAEEWDNVGMLIRPQRVRRVDRILLTIDVTEAVLDEAIRLKAKLVVGYHPLIFTPIKWLSCAALGDHPQKIALRAIEAGIAVYSPHTALDAVPGGVNDWLCDGLGAGRRTAWRHAKTLPRSEQMKIVTFVPREHVDRLRAALAEEGAGRIGDYAQCSFNIEGFGTFIGGASTNPRVGSRGRLERVEEMRLEMVCHESALKYVIEELRRVHPYEEPAFEVYRQEPRPMVDTGAGRFLQLHRPVTLGTLVRRVKRHLGLKHVRVAAPDDVHAGRDKIDEIGVCAGAGGSLFEHTLFQSYLTGEMRHHDILAKVEQGAAVILTDHTHSERGYLPILKSKLHEKLGDAVKIDISKRDREPLRIV